jgi:heat shock protein HslJ
MRTFKFLLLISTLSFIFSCTEKHDYKTLKIASSRADCTGVGPQTCYWVLDVTDSINGNWGYFYEAIEGFEYEPGYVYTIKVAVTELPSEAVPADASTIKYSLHQIEEKKKDPLLVLHDIWVAEELMGEIISFDSTHVSELPQIEIFPAIQKALGSDGCNSTNATIKELTETKFVFGNVASTRMMCPDMTIPDQYNQALGLTQSWKIVNTILHFMDIDGRVIVKFKKID